MKGKIFTAPEVQSILSGNKKMFREVIKNANYDSPVHSYKDWENNGLYYPVVTLVDENGTQFTETQYSFDGIRCPYQIGQKIFCKESFNIFAGRVAYKQSLANAERYIWKPATQMKQEHSRLTLQIKEIRVERLKDISEFEAFEKEGMPSGTPIYWFAEEWNKKHKKPEEKFEANPFVWSIQFEVVNE
jgi:hypothetical protein